ncbi:acyl-CoA-binding protein [Persicobacter psychrovividus]|uniref:Acyl-CoA-binding protein n=1 Tax=Persicobacter psychrovividus TaxID=387638 RepID=A0ABM7VEF2_9BACT|nr:acyl-CoA-binding protein [Persicobacter psychrovividus]
MSQALKASFQDAISASQQLKERPSNQDLLQLYALYKQGTEGDNQQTPPSGFDFKAAAKHKAWQQLEGLAQEKAMEQYVALVEKLKG